MSDLGFADVLEEADRIAEEIVAIASNVEFADLRSDMIERLVMAEFFGKKADPLVKKMIMVRTITLLATAVGLFTDEIHRTSAPIGED